MGEPPLQLQPGRWQGGLCAGGFLAEEVEPNLRAVIGFVLTPRVRIRWICPAGSVFPSSFRIPVLRPRAPGLNVTLSSGVLPAGAAAAPVLFSQPNNQLLLRLC